MSFDWRKPAKAPISPDMVRTAQDLFDQDTNIADASRQLFSSFGPNIDDLAVTLTAVWGDSLAVGSAAGPNAGKLTTVLANGSGATWPREHCAAAANRALSNWHGGLIRKSRLDVGVIPYPGHSLFLSPDLIATGAEPASAFQRAFWTSAIGRHFGHWEEPADGPNHVCVRVENQFPGEEDARVTLFASRLGIGWTRPSLWKTVPTAKGKTTVGLVRVANGRMAITADPFAFVPAQDASIHVDFTALVSSPYLKNTRPADSNFDIASWLKWNGGVGWHGLCLMRGGEVSLGLSNVNPTPERFLIEAVCHGLPDGTAIRLFSQQGGVPVDSGPLVLTGGAASASTIVSLPGDYEGTVNVAIDTPEGTGLPAGASVELQNYWLVDSAHDQFERVVLHLARAREALSADDTAHLYIGNCILIGDA
jgi:hypothetical protein